jgi:UDPglucose--hexose-1-phosphate uridylyltransferase
MSELRFNVISKEWVIIASERAKRPQDFRKTVRAEAAPAFDKDCPFCPGNEGGFSDETFRIGDKKIWKARAVYNKFPALSPDRSLSHALEGMHNRINGYGDHEVIVEHARHDMLIPLMSDEDVCNIIKIYKSRYDSLKKMGGIEAITIFKNQGLGAGASKSHPHSQLVATPIVPPQIRNRLDSAVKYFDVTGRCVICDMLAGEVKEKKRIIRETGGYVSLVPYASAAPFIFWIVPKRHAPSFGDIDEAGIAGLGGILKDALSRLYHGLDNPDYNFTIRSIPVNECGRDYFHWYLTIVPRISQPAGFELGSGIFINASIPEECAEFLRCARTE